MIYRGNDVRFELPTGFRDKTVHVLEAALPTKSTLNVLMYRAPFEGQASLREMVEAQLEKDRKSLQGHTVLEQREIEVDDQPALATLCRWKTEKMVVVERRAAISLGDAWLLVVVNAKVEERAQCDATMAHLLSTLRVRQQ